MLFKKKRSYKKSSLSDRVIAEIVIVFLFILSIVIPLAIFGMAGSLGRGLDRFLFFFLGYGEWFLPILFLSLAVSVSRDKYNQLSGFSLLGLFLFIFCASSLLEYFFPGFGGGLVGIYSFRILSPIIGLELGAFVFASGGVLSLLFLFNTSLSKLVGEESIFLKTITSILKFIISPFVRKDDEEEEDDEEEGEAEEDEREEAEIDKLEEAEDTFEVKEYEREDEAEEVVNEGIKTGSAKNNKTFAWEKNNIEMDIPIDLLKSKSKKPISGNNKKYQDIIRETLGDFGIPVSMSDVTVGPTVTQYSLKPNKGVSVSRIRSLADDLALNLAVHSIRIEAPIPGKSLVGIEIPNQSKVMVSLKELINSKVFKARVTNTVIPMGRDVTGKILTDDLVKMPHILIAGATNSGKSVFLHSLIMSLMFQNNPDDLQFIMIDQKQVELSLYNDIPYLVAPVITEHKRAIRALQWSVTEMDRRLELINNAKCQNIADYNKQKKTDTMPYLVVVVDELGDLMSAAKKEAESAIIRLGQKSRASGIHLVLATQRPSVDIISGLIKANMPARAAFSVTSSINSRTILDFTGAEQLMGQGDMLYINSTTAKPIRIQGAYVSKEEIKAVVKYVKNKAGIAKYEQSFETKEQGNFDFGSDYEEGDAMMEEAKTLILDSGKASATMLQSRLGIGYPRANRILDNLEKQGIVGPSVQNKPREVFDI